MLILLSLITGLFILSSDYIDKIVSENDTLTCQFQLEASELVASDNGGEEWVSREQVGYSYTILQTSDLRNLEKMEKHESGWFYTHSAVKDKYYLPGKSPDNHTQTILYHYDDDKILRNIVNIMNIEKNIDKVVATTTRFFSGPHTSLSVPGFTGLMAKGHGYCWLSNSSPSSASRMPASE